MRVPTVEDDVFVSHLCQKVDRPVGSRPIETVRGMGHSLRRHGGRA